MNKNIVLIGFMGAGKSMAANELAVRLKMDPISTDALIEEREGRPIAEIFESAGEVHFRQLEREIVQEIARTENQIIDCGGGVFISEENRDLLKKNSVVIYLKASPEMIYERTKELGHRPLLNVGDPQQKIAELLEARESFYQQADHTIDTNHKTNDQVCNEIEEILTNE